MKQISQMTQNELWEELFCRIARIEDKLEINEHEEPMPNRVRDALREDMKNFGQPVKTEQEDELAHDCVDAFHRTHPAGQE